MPDWWRRHYANAEFTQIHVCGTTCDALMNDPQATLDLVFGCTTGEVPTVQ